MSYEFTGADASFPAAADLTGKQFYAVTLNASSQAALCTAVGQKALGILQNAPTAQGRTCSVRVRDISKAIAGGTVTAWDPVGPDASGKLVKMDEDDEAVLGRCLVTSSVNEFFPLLITHEGSAAALQDTVGLIAAANYSVTGQYLAVKAHSTAGEFVKIAAANDNIMGVLQNAPAAGAVGNIKVQGVTTITAGTGNLAAGDRLQVDSSGQFTTATGGPACGFALAAITDGSTGLGFLMPQWLIDMVGAALTATNFWVGNGSNVAAAVAMSGDATMDNAGAVTIGAKKIGVAKMASAAQGTVFRTDAANAVSELSLADGKVAVGDGTDVAAVSAKTSGQILVGDGTTLASVALGGDATLIADGTMTVGAKKIAAAKLYSAAQGVVLRGEAANVIGELDLSDGKVAVGDGTDVAAVAAKTAGQILVGDGTTLASVAVSGDAALASGGALTLAKPFIRQLITTWTDTQIKAGNVTPLVLADFSALSGAGVVAAGDCLVFHGVIANLYGGVAYDNNENSIIKYQTAGGGATVSTTLANWFNGGADGEITTLKMITTDFTPEINEDLVWTMSASPFNAAGSRALKVALYYSVYTPGT